MCKFARAKRLKGQEYSNHFSWQTLEIVNLMSCSLQSFDELTKLKILWNQFLWTFYHFGFYGSVVKEQLCLCKMLHTFKIGVI